MNLYISRCKWRKNQERITRSNLLQIFIFGGDVRVQRYYVINKFLVNEYWESSEPSELSGDVLSICLVPGFRFRTGSILTKCKKFPTICCYSYILSLIYTEPFRKWMINQETSFSRLGTISSTMGTISLTKNPWIFRTSQVLDFCDHQKFLDIKILKFPSSYI